MGFQVSVHPLEYLRPSNCAHDISAELDLSTPTLAALAVGEKNYNQGHFCSEDLFVSCYFYH